MQQSQLKVLIVEDVPTDAELAKRELQRAGIACEMVRVETKAAFLRKLEELKPDLIISDFSLPEFDGKSALALATEKYPDIPFIFVSGTIGEEAAIESLKSGATDYILKNNLKRLASAVRRALQDKQERAARRKAEQEIADQRVFFRKVIDLDRNFIFAKDREGRFTLVNQAIAEAYGTTVDALLGKTDANFNPNKEEVEHFRRNDLEVMDTLREKFIPEEMITDAAGRARWLQTVKRPIISPDGKANMVLGVATDITERKLQEEKIARLSRIQKVLSGINSAIVRIHDREELFREACRIAVEHGGFKLAWIGMHNEQAHEVSPLIWAGHHEGFLSEIRFSTRPDVPEKFGVAGRAIHDNKTVVVNDIANDPRILHTKELLQRGFRAIVSLPLLVEGEAIGAFVLYGVETGVFDQEEMKLLNELAGDVSFALEVMKKEAQLAHLAYHDVLTGLPNLQLLHDRLAQAVNASATLDRKVALMVSDVERFSMLNDTLGKSAGDAVLKTIAARLGRECDPGDTVARIGSDSFGVILNDVDSLPKMVRALTENFTATVPRASGDNPGPVSVQLRWGVAIYPDDGSGSDQLMGNAQAALRSAQESREDCVFYAPQMNARVAEILSLENKLRIAIADKQFVLHYQPKVDLASNRITGLEALIRWNSPEMGLVPPYKFIPILEETGMILEVGMWVLRQAAQEQRQWLQQGLKPPRVAVNISSLQLRHRDFADEVMRVVARGKDNPVEIDLEITESVIMSDIEQYIPKLKAIRKMGVGIEIDDFGTGYSSLSYIAKLPVTALKIDRSFVNEMAQGDDSLSIISTIISLAHALNLRVVAEGVETEAQRELLQMLKCDEMQGYLFSKPLPAAEIEALLVA